MDKLDRSFWSIGIFGLFCIVFAEMSACAFQQAHASPVYERESCEETVYQNTCQ